MQHINIDSAMPCCDCPCAVDARDLMPMRSHLVGLVDVVVMGLGGLAARGGHRDGGGRPGESRGRCKGCGHGGKGEEGKGELHGCTVPGMDCDRTGRCYIHIRGTRPCACLLYSRVELVGGAAATHGQHFCFESQSTYLFTRLMLKEPHTRRLWYK